jgi:predicted metalloprotease with PDZ domain
MLRDEDGSQEEDMTRRIGWTALVMFFGLSLFAQAGEKTHCAKQAGDCAKAMYDKLGNAGWLGIETDKSDKGVVTIKAVVPDSPAVAAGFQPGDVLVAINGVEIAEANKEALMAAKKSLVAGSEGRYTVLRHGAKKNLTAMLVAPPRTVLAQWIGEHMLAEHVGTQVAAK